MYRMFLSNEWLKDITFEGLRLIGIMRNVRALLYYVHMTIQNQINKK